MAGRKVTGRKRKITRNRGPQRTQLTADQRKNFKHKKGPDGRPLYESMNAPTLRRYVRDSGFLIGAGVERRKKHELLELLRTGVAPTPGMMYLVVGTSAGELVDALPFHDRLIAETYRKNWEDEGLDAVILERRPSGGF